MEFPALPAAREGMLSLKCSGADPREAAPALYKSKKGPQIKAGTDTRAMRRSSERARAGSAKARGPERNGSTARAGNRACRRAPHPGGRPSCSALRAAAAGRCRKLPVLDEHSQDFARQAGAQRGRRPASRRRGLLAAPALQYIARAAAGRRCLRRVLCSVGRWNL